MAFFHWFDFKNPIASHNLFIRKGALAALPWPPGSINPYYASVVTTGVQRDKERVFEEIRYKEFPHCPSRCQALWIFDDSEIAKKCGERWGFLEQGRELFEVGIEKQLNYKKVDSQWLNCVVANYVENARQYWGGSMTESPNPEILFFGLIKLLGDGWQNKCRLLSPNV